MRLQSIAFVVCTLTIRLGIGAPPDIGFTFLDGGYAVEWRTYTGSFITAPGAGATHVRGTVLAVYKRLPDGSWRTFRALGSVEPVTKDGGL